MRTRFMGSQFLRQHVASRPPSQVIDTQARDIGLPSTEQLLVLGGDSRTALDLLSGLNKYGCQPFPDFDLLSFGSSTASVISTDGFIAAEALRQKLLLDLCSEPCEAIYAHEIRRIRVELLKLCEVSDLRGLEVIFSASGTDVHQIAALYAGSGETMPARVVMVEAHETGSGVAAALSGKCLNSIDLATDSDALEVMSVPIRLPDGSLRPLVEIDAEFERLANEAEELGRRVLLILVDQSKTGLIAPSPACVANLYHRMADKIDVMVDACQFRIAPETLRAYLEQGFMVALTGSKFVTGPSFSAALLLPSVAAQRLHGRTFPDALTSCAPGENWPPGWESTKKPGHAVDMGVDSFGLLLRWEVALVELRKFRSLPQAGITTFLQAFAHAVRNRLESDPFFALLPVPPLDRSPLIEANSWDHQQTIFPFLLYHPATYAGRKPLCRTETKRVYEWLQADLGKNTAFSFEGSDVALASVRCQFGQPVACGSCDGVEVSALRVCVSARLIVEALSPDGKGAVAVINDALAAINKTALLIRSGFTGSE